MDHPLVAYLHDHLAGSSFAVELLEKLASEFSGTPSGDVARDLLEQVKLDRKTLEQLIEKVGKANPDLYDALGWIAERVSRIKLKHDDPSGIGALEAFETVSLGILGKRALWEALQTPPAFRPSDRRRRLSRAHRSSGATISKGESIPPGVDSRRIDRAGPSTARVRH